MSTPEPVVVREGASVNSVVWTIFGIAGSLWFIVDLFQSLT